MSMKKYVVALDQGTTSSRAVIFDREQNIAGIAQREYTQYYPKEGWVEHDPMEIYASQYGVLIDALLMSGIPAEEIAAIGITNQRETTIVWEKSTGRPGTSRRRCSARPASPRDRPRTPTAPGASF